LGWRAAERLPTLFVREIEKLKPGQLSQVIRSAAGFHLLRLNDQRQVSAVAGPPVAQWRARHILFRVSESLPEAEATRRAQDMVTRLKAGEDFAELAKKHSADGSAAKGGDLGWLLPGDTVPEFERAMSRLEAKEVSDPVRSPFGIHVIQVLEKRTDVPPIERQRAQIRQALRERKAEEAYDSWLQELRDRAYVEYRGDSL
jgi:peptidyl-prolyl cis-trans isomerase SurA